MKGKFIVIEGIDGCGKTTQIDELSKWLPKSGLINSKSKLITTREPGGSLLGQKLRRLIIDNNKSEKELVSLTLRTASKFIRSQLRNKPQNLTAKQWIANELMAKRRT